MLIPLIVVSVRLSYHVSFQNKPSNPIVIQKYHHFNSKKGYVYIAFSRYCATTIPVFRSAFSYRSISSSFCAYQMQTNEDGSFSSNRSPS